MATVSHTFKKEERLKSRKLIQLLFRSGKSFTVFPFRIYYLPVHAPGTNTPVQAGFSVSSRAFRKAVHRNRIKRLTRESWRLQKHEFYDFLATQDLQIIIFFLYIGREVPKYPLVSEKISVILTKLKKELFI